MKVYALNVLAILVTFLALSTGLAAAQSAADVGVNQPTSGELLSGATRDNATNQLNTTEVGKTTDVTKLADVNQVFTTNPGEAMNISAVNFVGGDRWAQITNDGIIDRNLTGWMLVSSKNATYKFPTFVLPTGASIRVHQGPGQSTASNIYMNSNVPFFNDPNGIITLLDNTGKIVTRYLPPSAAGAALTPTPSFQPVLITPTGTANTTANATANNETSFNQLANTNIGLTSVNETSFAELAASNESASAANNTAASSPTSKTGTPGQNATKQNSAAVNSITSNIGYA